jgi:MFS transporter, DHA1 family, multidrug resistance protein
MFSPALGSLMDSVGRKPVFLASLLALASANAIVSVHPNVASISMAKVVNSFVTGLFFIASQTVISDSISSQPERMSSAIGIQLSLTSLGFMIGAVAAGRIAEHGLRITYGMSTVVALFALMFGITLTETLTPENRLPVERNVMKLIQSPLTAARIFRHEKLRVLVILLLLSSMPAFMGDVFQIYTKVEWGLEAKNYSTFLAIFGIIGISGNMVGSMLVQKIGNKTFTMLSTLSSLCVPIGIILYQYRGLQVGAMIGFLSSAQKMGITAALISEGAKIGVPQGELAGERSSILALLKVVSPILYSLLYVQGKKMLSINILPFLFNIGLSFLAFTICTIHL